MPFQYTNDFLKLGLRKLLKPESKRSIITIKIVLPSN